MRIWTLAAIFAASLALSPPANAQDPSAGTPSPRGLDPVVLKGPPAADEFARITGLEPAQRARYAELQQRFMASTQPQRDSLKASFAAMRESYQKGDRQRGRAQRPALRELRDNLADQQRHFEETVKEFLNQDQWKKYEQWREEERERVKKEWRERRGHHPA